MNSTISTASTLVPWAGFSARAVDTSALRFVCLAIAILVYALFSSPTPNAPGMAEGVMALCLVFAAGIPGLLRAFTWDNKAPVWFFAAQIFFVYGIGVATIAGVVHGNDTMHMLRDILPFLFLVLPLFLSDIFANNPLRQKQLAMLLAFTGVAFAVRAAPEIIAWWQPGIDTKDIELYYFENAPSVLFAALFLSGAALKHFVQRFSLVSAPLFLLACLPVLAMGLTLQRASIVCFMLGSIIMAAVFFVRRPGPTILFCGILLLAAVPFSGLLIDLAGEFIHKTANVGVNARGAEVSAVWGEISASPGQLFFGSGWGGMFDSPAVGNMRINYTHSLLSALLLKMGLIGLALGFFYLAALAENVFVAGKRNIILAMALAAPLFIDVFFYASYKFFDFGLILLLLAAFIRPSAVAQSG